MAMYEYYCEHCDYYFEINKKISKMNEMQVCLNCEHTAKRQFPHKIGAIVFKGEGFHKTDYPAKKDGK